MKIVLFACVCFFILIFVFEMNKRRKTKKLIKKLLQPPNFPAAVIRHIKGNSVFCEYFIPPRPGYIGGMYVIQTRSGVFKVVVSKFDQKNSPILQLGKFVYLFPVLSNGKIVFQITGRKITKSQFDKELVRLHIEATDP